MGTFHGGETDHYLDSPPHFAQRMRNCLLDANGKPFQRNGTAMFHSTRIAANQRISSLHVLQNNPASSFVPPPDVNKKTLFAHSATQLWYAADLTSASAPSSWTEIEGDNGVKPGRALDVNSRAHMFQYGIFSMLSFWISPEMYSPRYFPRVKRIFTSIATNQLELKDLGLPTPTFTPSFPSGTGIGGTEYTFLYYFVYKWTYTINGVSYVERSAPLGPITVENQEMPDSGAGVTLDIEDLTPFKDTTEYDEGCYSLNDAGNIGTVSTEIYRTKGNERVARLVTTLNPADDDYTDGTPDSSLGEILYTMDGTRGHEQAPRGKLFTITGDTAYYSGFDLTRANGGGVENLYGADTVMQAIPGAIGAVPADFEIRMPGSPTALATWDIYPVVFLRGSCWRIEGQIDRFGNGSPIPRAISEKIGCIHPSSVRKVHDGLVFASIDGLYWTNAFQIRKYTEHLNRSYKRWWAGHTFDKDNIGALSSAFHPDSNRYLISYNEDTPQSGACNRVAVVDLRHDHEKGKAVTTWDGQNNSKSGGNCFLPMSMDVLDDILLIGDYRGYVLKIKMDAEEAAAFKGDDVRIDTAVAIANFATQAVVFDFISTCFNFGSRAVKWVSDFTATFLLRVAQTKLYVDIFTINDGKYRTDADNDARQLKLCREESIDSERTIFSVWRRMKAGTLRCRSKQVRFKKANCRLYASHPNGTQVYVAGTVNGSANTVALSAGSWPAASELIGQTIYLENDDYTQGYEITARTASTLTVADAGNVLPTGSYKWEIWGYPNSQGWGLDDIAMNHVPLDVPSDAYKTSDSGANE